MNIESIQKAQDEINDLAEFLERLATTLSTAPEGEEGVDYISKALGLDLSINKELLGITPLAKTPELAELEAEKGILTKTKQLEKAIEKKIKELHG